MSDDEEDNSCLSGGGGEDETRGSACWAVDLAVAAAVAVGLLAVAAVALSLARWRSRCHPAEHPIRAVQVGTASSGSGLLQENGTRGLKSFVLFTYL